MADEHTIKVTLNGADVFEAQARQLAAALGAAGTIEEVERRIGRKIDSEMICELFVVQQIGAELWIEATPEFNRVMAALRG